MDVKSMIHMMLWGTIDGMAALWVLHILGGIAKGSQVADSLLFLARTVCG